MNHTNQLKNKFFISFWICHSKTVPRFFQPNHTNSDAWTPRSRRHGGSGLRRASGRLPAGAEAEFAGGGHGASSGASGGVACLRHFKTVAKAILHHRMKKPLVRNPIANALELYGWLALNQTLKQTIVVCRTYQVFLGLGKVTDFRKANQIRKFNS